MTQIFKENKYAQILMREIPNLLDYYEEKEVLDILDEIGIAPSESIVELFMDEEWERPMRRCTHCGKLMTEGYMLAGEYACSDDCRNALYDPNDSENAYRLYLIDYFEIEPEEVEGMTADEIMEAYADCDGSDNIMYTEWM